MAEIYCEPLQPIKSSAQTKVDENLSKSVEPFRTFAIIGKTGDVVIPANVHARFYNCNFDKFTAKEGNNIFYFEQCTFSEPVDMSGVTFIAAGTTFREGGFFVRCKGELVEHIVPSTTEAEGSTAIPCAVNNTFYLQDHCQMKSKGTHFEWLDAAANFLDAGADFIGDLDNALKSILSMLDFSRFESMLDKFINIPFAILNMVNGCVANISRMIIGKIDELLAPIFTAAGAAKDLINAINRLISTVRSIPQRIANLYKRCYAKIVNTAELVSRQVTFSINNLSRVDVMLTQRVMSLEGSIASVKDSSKCCIKNVKHLISPGKSTYAEMFKLDTKSFAEVARIGEITTATASLVSVKNKSIYKLFAAKTVQSTSQLSDALIKSEDSDVDITKVASCTTELSAIAKASDGGVIRLNAIDSIVASATADTTPLFQATTGGSIFLNNKVPTNAFSAITV